MALASSDPAMKKLVEVSDHILGLEVDKASLEKQLANKITALAATEHVNSIQAARIRVLESVRRQDDERALLVFLSGRIENQALRAGINGLPLRDYVFEELDRRMFDLRPAVSWELPSYNSVTRRRFSYVKQIGKLHVYEEV